MSERERSIGSDEQGQAARASVVVLEESLDEALHLGRSEHALALRPHVCDGVEACREQRDELVRAPDAGHRSGELGRRSVEAELAGDGDQQGLQRFPQQIALGLGQVVECEDAPDGRREHVVRHGAQRGKVHVGRQHTLPGGDQTVQGGMELRGGPCDVCVRLVICDPCKPAHGRAKDLIQSSLLDGQQPGKMALAELVEHGHHVHERRSASDGRWEIAPVLVTEGRQVVREVEAVVEEHGRKHGHSLEVRVPPSGHQRAEQIEGIAHAVEQLRRPLFVARLDVVQRGVRQLDQRVRAGADLAWRQGKHTRQHGGILGSTVASAIAQETATLRRLLDGNGLHAVAEDDVTCRLQEVLSALVRAACRRGGHHLRKGRGVRVQPGLQQKGIEGLH
eukprot:m.142616 g.142616  ORF g.142616 m.142616 type:complete len:393 (-) comp9651_c0_seq2:1082-2260(-)